MKTVGIVAEYNPFHNGHAYLIDKARKNGATHVIAVMSGSFVQRGEPAAFSTFSRAKAAVNCGVDLVLQLPVACVLSGAQKFAAGGISVLESCGLVDSIAFGSESGKADDLYKAAEILASDKVSDVIVDELQKGITYAAARENALRMFNSELADMISQPNNILGIEYIGSLLKSGSSIKAETYGRVGTFHDSQDTCGKYASASELRNKAASGDDWMCFVPEGAFEIQNSDYRENAVSAEKFEAAMLYRMRTASLEYISRLPDISEGLENRIMSSVAKASSLEGLYSEIKTKRYTMARIRRILSCALIGITTEDAAMSVPYIRVLALNDRGAELLSMMRKSATLPVLAKSADIKEVSEEGRRMFELECRATDIRFSMTKTCSVPGLEKKIFPFKI